MSQPDLSVPTFRTLTVIFNGQPLMTRELSTPTYSIGQLPDNSLVLLDASPRHAEIRIVAGRAMLIDLDSRQGTAVGGVRLQPHQPQALVDGATIRIGSYDIVYRSQIDQPEPPVASDVAEPLDSTAIEAPVVAAPLPDLAGLVSRRLRPLSANGIFAIGRYVRFLPDVLHEEDGHRRAQMFTRGGNDTLGEDLPSTNGKEAFIARFLKIFESLWEPLEQRQDHVDMYFSPRTCPTAWLPWFASWFGLELDPSLSEARVRLLLANTIEIYRWRGTKYGLTRVIEVCLGVRPVIHESTSRPNVFHVRVRLPDDATPDFLPRLRALISAHKPAHTGYVLEVQK